RLAGQQRRLASSRVVGAERLGPGRPVARAAGVGGVALGTLVPPKGNRVPFPHDRAVPPSTAVEQKAQRFPLLDAAGAPSRHRACCDSGCRSTRRLPWRKARRSRAPCASASLLLVSSSEDRAPLTPGRSPRRASPSSPAWER